MIDIDKLFYTARYKNTVACGNVPSGAIGNIVTGSISIHICCLAVDLEYRKQGIASALLEKAPDELGSGWDITVSTFRENDATRIAGGKGMLEWLFGGVKKNEELEHLMERIRNNVENNYKDAAQEYLVEYEEKLKELAQTGKLSQKQEEYYSSRLQDLKNNMKGFTHKDQKPYWT